MYLLYARSSVPFATVAARINLSAHLLRATHRSGTLPNVASIIHSSVLPLSANEPDTEDGTDKPEDSAQEAEGFAGHPTMTNTTMGDAIPVEDAVAAATVMDGVDEKTKCSEPGGREDEVDRPVYEAASEGE